MKLKTLLGTAALLTSVTGAAQETDTTEPSAFELVKIEAAKAGLVVQNQAYKSEDPEIGTLTYTACLSLPDSNSCFLMDVYGEDNNPADGVLSLGEVNMVTVYTDSEGFATDDFNPPSDDEMKDVIDRMNQMRASLGGSSREYEVCSVKLDEGDQFGSSATYVAKNGEWGCLGLENVEDRTQVVTSYEDALKIMFDNFAAQYNVKTEPKFENK